MSFRLAALVVAALVVGAPRGASAQAAPFEVMPLRPSEKPSHRLAWITAIAGAGLVAGSFPLAAEADQRYQRYLDETDVSRLDERFRATERMDRLASGVLLTGEALLATAVWLRFVRHPGHESHLTFALEPRRCACVLRF